MFETGTRAKARAYMPAYSCSLMAEIVEKCGLAADTLGNSRRKYESWPSSLSKLHPHAEACEDSLRSIRVRVSTGPSSEVYAEDAYTWLIF